MKLPRKYKNSFAGIALLCVAIGANALTLGRARGVVLLGQPLDLTIAVQQSADEEVAALCFDADVFHADSKLDASRVRVRLEPGVGQQTTSVRVSSTVNIDEPVVTVYLRAGCGQKTTRRYVLLAELASDITPIAATAPAAAAVPAATMTAVPLVNPAPTTSEPAIPVLARKPGSSGAARTPASAASNSPAVAARKSVVRKQNAEGARSHLRLDLTELTADSVVSLRLSNELSIASAGNEKLRAEAVALWRAINAQPEDVLRDASRVEALEGDVKALRSMSGKNLESMADLRLRLQKAESERFANGLVYGLLALLVLATAAAAYFWNRQRARLLSSDDWWETSHTTAGALGRSSGGAPLEASAAESRFPHTGVPVPPVRAQAGAGGVTEVDIDLSVDEGLFASLKDSRVHPHQVAGVPADERVTELPSLAGLLASRPQEPRDFSPSISSTLRAINAEEVFDIRQQAEFFLSLGQYDRAIQVLENRIEDHGESSPFVYLDLLKIFHTLGRKSEFQKFRGDFNMLFKGVVPEFARFSDEGNSLEDYPAAMTRVTELWPMPEVQDFIEDCIFRNAGDDQGIGFDLAAFSELLFLHAIAKRLAGEATGTDDSRYAVLIRDPGKMYADPVQVTAPMPVSTATGLQDVDFELDLDLPQGYGVQAPSPTPSASHVHLDGDDNLIDFELSPEIRRPK